MDEQIIEGLWDCPYCGTKGIGGLTKHCPCCGHPQDAGTEFYMGEEIKYVEDELAEQYGQGADWVCGYCDSLNRVRYKYCANCGAPADSSEKDYFTSKEKKAAPQPEPPKKPKKKRKLLPFILLGLLALFFIINWPRDYDATVETKSWLRQIQVEAYRTVQESDWSVPEGGRPVEEKQEIRDYKQVVDHYERKSRQVSEQVYDGEDYHTSYQNNGDGTFTQITTSTPRYRTEYRTEYYDEPVYRKEPIYDIKYYYDIEKWVIDRTEEAAGAEDTPYWPEVVLAENERSGEQTETYTVEVATESDRYVISIPRELWDTLHPGDSVVITVMDDEVTHLNDTKIE